MHVRSDFVVAGIERAGESRRSRLSSLVATERVTAEADSEVEGDLDDLEDGDANELEGVHDGDPNDEAVTGASDDGTDDGGSPKL